MREKRAYWPQLGAAAEPAVDGATWPICGHPRTIANTAPAGRAGARCRICRRKIWRDFERRKAGKG